MSPGGRRSRRDRTSGSHRRRRPGATSPAQLRRGGSARSGPRGSMPAARSPALARRGADAMSSHLGRPTRPPRRGLAWQTVRTGVASTTCCRGLAPPVPDAAWRTAAGRGARAERWGSRRGPFDVTRRSHASGALGQVVRRSASTRATWSPRSGCTANPATPQTQAAERCDNAASGPASSTAARAACSSLRTEPATRSVRRPTRSTLPFRRRCFEPDAVRPSPAIWSPVSRPCCASASPR